MEEKWDLERDNGKTGSETTPADESSLGHNSKTDKETEGKSAS